MFLPKILCNCKNETTHEFTLLSGATTDLGWGLLNNVRKCLRFGTHLNLQSFSGVPVAARFYLTCVSTAEMWGHLSNIAWYKRVDVDTQLIWKPSLSWIRHTGCDWFVTVSKHKIKLITGQWDWNYDHPYADFIMWFGYLGHWGWQKRLLFYNSNFVNDSCCNVIQISPKFVTQSFNWQ